MLFFSTFLVCPQKVKSWPVVDVWGVGGREMVTLSKRRFFAGSKRGFFPGSETDSSPGSDSDPEEFARLLVICSAFSTSACVANSTYLKCCQRNRRNKQIKREEGGEGEREGGRGKGGEGRGERGREEIE